MTDEEIAQVMREVEALRAEQERAGRPEDLAKLPRLSVADIGDAPKETPARMVEAPLPCLAHELDTHHIVYAYHYFDLRRLAWEDLPYVGLLCNVLGRLDTERLSAAELDTVVEENLGTLNFFFETYGNDDDPDFVQPHARGGRERALREGRELATLPAEVWGNTRFDDTERIHAILSSGASRSSSTS